MNFLKRAINKGKVTKLPYGCPACRKPVKGVLPFSCKRRHFNKGEVIFTGTEQLINWRVEGGDYPEMGHIKLAQNAV